MIDFILITSPIWLFVIIGLGLREITSSKYDEQWHKMVEKILNWWDKA